MRCAEQQPVRGLVLVAPYFTDLGLEQVRRAGWVNERWDWARVRAHSEHIAMFHSDDDPYVTQPELAQLREHLQADVHVIDGAGHFGAQDTFPELQSLIIKLYGPQAR
jgi:predicted alpha/beta hydrolase family esterase